MCIRDAAHIPAHLRRFGSATNKKWSLPVLLCDPLAFLLKRSIKATVGLPTPTHACDWLDHLTQSSHTPASSPQGQGRVQKSCLYDTCGLLSLWLLACGCGLRKLLPGFTGAVKGNDPLATTYSVVTSWGGHLRMDG